MDENTMDTHTMVTLTLILRTSDIPSVVKYVLTIDTLALNMNGTHHGYTRHI
jgi:hypothetical protein